jgi:hypothetical protein
VRESVKNKVGDVLIGQTIENVFAVAAAGDQAFAAEDAEALGDGGEVFAFGRGDLCHTRFALAEQGEEAEAGPIAHGAENARGALNGAGLDQGHPLAVEVFVRGTGWVGHFRHRTLEQLFK